MWLCRGRKDHPSQVLTFLWSLPGVNCPDCGSSYGEMRLLPVEFPLALREELEAICEQNGCRPWSEFQRFAQKWRKSLFETTGMEIDLRPGDRFFPADWHLRFIPNMPVYSSFRSLIVRGDLARRLASVSTRGLLCVPICKILLYGRYKDDEENLDLSYGYFDGDGPPLLREIQHECEPYFAVDASDDFTDIYFEKAKGYVRCATCGGIDSPRGGANLDTDVLRNELSQGIISELAVQPHLDFYRLCGYYVISDEIHDILSQMSGDSLAFVKLSLAR